MIAVQLRQSRASRLDSDLLYLHSHAFPGSCVMPLRRAPRMLGSGGRGYFSGDLSLEASRLTLTRQEHEDVQQPGPGTRLISCRAFAPRSGLPTTLGHHVRHFVKRQVREISLLICERAGSPGAI